MNAALAILSASALALAPAPSAADLGDIKDRGTLRVIVSADEAPETFDAKGRARPGFERELVESFAALADEAAAAGVRSLRRFESSGEMLAALSGGEITALDEYLANVRKSASWDLLLVKYFGELAPLVLGRRR